MSKHIKAAFLVCPGYLPVDVIGAHTTLGFLPNTEVHLVWKNKEPVIGFPSYPTIPTTTVAECPDDLDVLCIGAIPGEVLADQETISFVQKHAANGCNMMGICGGALLLGAAGLLKGRKATSNFNTTAPLEKFGAIPVFTSEVVVDGNYYTAGPATGGIEAALLLISKLRGKQAAQFVELVSEYDPHPPFGCGNANTAPKHLVQQAAAMNKEQIEKDVAMAYDTFLRNKN
ncbi:MAG TPA: dihydroxy-acid dehydratase [Ruminococcaceae bacterium]|nr:dihydroxy-acid dehydratase [Oscillospiraceae bacterium]